MRSGIRECPQEPASVGKRLSKSQRASLREMFGGRCAYCGGMLGERWHADHVEPVLRQDWIGKPAAAPENHRLDNFMPACAPCNISKGRMTIEVWRAWLLGHVNSLNQHHSIYRMVKAFGLVAETGDPVIFHFERAGSRPHQRYLAAGDLDAGIPNGMDQAKRGFRP